jgi:hypothetical protein
MQLFSLLAIPNQSIVTTQDSNRYELRFVACNGCVACDVTLNGQTLFAGVRIVAGVPIIPFPYLEAEDGNFIIVCDTEDLIDYTLFGSSQNLYYLSNAEMHAL